MDYNLQQIIGTSISIWFFFYLWNYSFIFSKAKEKVESCINKYFVYMINCSFCFTFWICLAFAMFGVLSSLTIITAPVINLILDLSFNKLKTKELENNISTSDKSPVFEIKETSNDIQTR